MATIYGQVNGAGGFTGENVCVNTRSFLKTIKAWGEHSLDLGSKTRWVYFVEHKKGLFQTLPVHRYFFFI